MNKILAIVIGSILGLSTQANAETKTAANQLAGHMVKFQGKVLILTDQSKQPLPITIPGSPLLVENLLHTKKNSTGSIQWIDGSKIVMKELSKLRIKTVDYIRVEDGMVIFDITKKIRPRPVRVGVKLAILGIRGTRFLVDSRQDDTYQVYLKKGQITIASMAEDFRIYKQQIEAQMRQFREQLERESIEFNQDLVREFKQFKQQTTNAQTEFVKEFTMLESTGVAIKGNLISLIPIPQNIDEQFELLDRF